LPDKSATDSSLLTGFPLVPSEDGADFRLWEGLVSEYSARQLSYATDKLPAVSSVASRFANSATGRYLAGLWEEDLVRGLMWRSSSGKRFGRRVPARRFESYIAPTWSWASIQGHVYWNALSKISTTPTTKAEIEEVKCVTKTGNAFMEVASAYIRLKCCLIKATYNAWHRDPDDDFDEEEHANAVNVFPPPRSGPRLVKSKGLDLDGQQFEIDTVDDETQCDGLEVHLAILWEEEHSYQGLVLRKMGDEEDAVYRRIGAMNAVRTALASECDQMRVTITVV
jgi:hypothetical protein